MIYKIKDKEINIAYSYKPTNKHCYIRYRDNTLYITSYQKMNEKMINKFILQNENSIFSIIQKMENRKTKDNINNILYNGNYYKLLISDEIDKSNYVYNDKIILKGNKSNYEIVIANFYLEKLPGLIEPIINSARGDFSDIINFDISIQYKSVKTYFGKCIPKQKKIVFSSICSKLNNDELKYVVYHELSHFKYLGHQADFYNYLESKMPGARKISRLLRKNK